MKNNKEMIEKLRDNAELVWASYGYFHLTNESYKPEEHSKDWERLKYFRELKEIELDTTLDEKFRPIHTDILDITYKYYLDEDGNPKDGIILGFFAKKLFDGDFSPNQAKRFFERYDLLDYYPKDNSKGFHACLFREIATQQYTFAIRGTEFKEIKQ